jgi:hypothetical protein
MKKRMIIGIGLIALGTLGRADNIFQENTPFGGLYKFENEFNWSTKSLTDSGLWFLAGTATVDQQTGKLTIDPQDEKGGLFIGRQGKNGSLNVTGGSLKILSNVILGHNGGTGTLNLSAGEIFIGGNLSGPAGKEIRLSGGTLQVEGTINSQVSEFRYTGGVIRCEHFGVSSGVFDIRIGPKTTPVDVKRSLFGSGVLTLSLQDGYEPLAGQEIVLFTFTSDDKMAWTDGQGGLWQDGKTLHFGGKAFTVVRKKDRLSVILQPVIVVG